MTIEPETQFAMVRDATRGQAPIAWVGWVFGIIALGLGLVAPLHWGLIVIGSCLLLAMVVKLVVSVRERLRHRRYLPHHAAPVNQ